MNKEAWARMAQIEEDYEFMYGPGYCMVGRPPGGGPIRVACTNCGAKHTKLEDALCVDTADCAKRKEMKQKYNAK